MYSVYLSVEEVHVEVASFKCGKMENSLSWLTVCKYEDLNQFTSRYFTEDTL